VLPVPCGATDPGTRRAKVKALRPASGSSWSALVLIVPAIRFELVSRTGVAPLTVMVSSSPPGTSFTRMSVVRDDSTTTLL
jgi:hypothetical protein